MNIDEACAEGNAEAAARRKSQNWIDLVVRDICEIPYRSSPGDQPNMMLVTPQELRNFIEQHAPPSAAALIAKRDAEIDQLRTRNEYLSQLMREPEQQQAFRAEAAERALAELEQIWHDIGAICASGWTRDNEARSPNEWAEALLYERDELREKLQAAERTLAKATSTLATISGYLYPEEVVLPDGRRFRFDNPAIEHEMLVGLSSAIRDALNSTHALAENAGQIKDAERMDWLEACGDWGLTGSCDASVVEINVPIGLNKLPDTCTIRDILDAAMATDHERSGK